MQNGAATAALQAQIIHMDGDAQSATVAARKIHVL